MNFGAVWLDVRQLGLELCFQLSDVAKPGGAKLGS